MNKITITVVDEATGDEKYKLEAGGVPDDKIIGEGYATPGLNSIILYLKEYI